MKNIKFYIVIAAIYSLIGSVQSLDAGTTASLDIGLVQDAKEVYWNYVMNILKKVEMPDISFKGGYINSNHFQVSEASKNVQIENVASKNGVKLSVNDLQAGFKSDSMKYKVSFITAKGSVEVKMSQVNVALTISLSTQQLSNGKTVPGFEISDVKVDVPSKHIDIKIKGNFISKIANAFKSVFKSQIIHQVEKEIVKKVQQELPKTLNKIISDQQGQTEVYNNMELDWTVPYAPNITEELLSFGIKGLFFQKNVTPLEPEALPPKGMPLHDDASPSKFQAFISTYLMESLLYTYLQTNKIQEHVYAANVLQDSPIQSLNTSSIGQYLPGLIKQYGENKPVDIEYNLDKVGNFSIREDDDTLSFDVSVTINLFVSSEPGFREKALDLKLISNHFNASVEIPSDSLNVTLNLKQLVIGDIQVISSTFGEIDFHILTSVLNMCIKYGMPYMNSYFKTMKIVIPEKLFGLFVLSDLTLKYHDSFIEAGLTPTFLPPKSDIPGVYQKFVPLKDFGEEGTEDFKTFMIQEIDENDNITYTYTDDFNMYNYASSVMKSIWYGDDDNGQEVDLFMI